MQNRGLNQSQKLSRKSREKQTGVCEELGTFVLFFMERRGGTRDGRRNENRDPEKRHPYCWKEHRG